MSPCLLLFGVILPNFSPVPHTCNFVVLMIERSYALCSLGCSPPPLLFNRQYKMDFLEHASGLVVRMLASSMRAPVFKSWIFSQLLVSTLGGSRADSSGWVSATPWETWAKFPVPSFSQGPPQPLRFFGKLTSRWELCLGNNKNKNKISGRLSHEASPVRSDSPGACPG